jgi:hypothetical protein
MLKGDYRADPWRYLVSGSLLVNVIVRRARQLNRGFLETGGKNPLRGGKKGREEGARTYIIER